jgi:hypothetical protein
MKNKILLTVLCFALAVGASAAVYITTSDGKLIPGRRLENITDYGKALADELGIHHAEVRMSYDVPVYAAVHFTVKRQGQLIKERTEALTEPSTWLGIWFLYRTSPIDPGPEPRRHFFKALISSIESTDRGPRTKEGIFLQEPRAAYKHAQSSHSINSSLFNTEKPLPVNKRVTYYQLLDKRIPDGEETLYTIDFEISDKPIEAAG